VKRLKQIVRIALSPLLIGALIGSGIPLAYCEHIGSDPEIGGFVRRAVLEDLAWDIVVWCCAGLGVGMIADWAIRNTKKSATDYDDADMDPRQISLRGVCLCVVYLGAAAACAVFGDEYSLVGCTAKYVATGALAGVALGILFGKRLLALALVGAALGLFCELLP
jgi:hypothetical protein